MKANELNGEPGMGERVPVVASIVNPATPQLPLEQDAYKNLPSGSLVRLAAKNNAPVAANGDPVTEVRFPELSSIENAEIVLSAFPIML